MVADGSLVNIDGVSILKKSNIAIALVSFAFVAGSALAQPAVIKANETVRADAQATAESLGEVKAETKVEIMERKGFWAKIKAGSLTGWVKMTALSIDSGNSSGGASALVGLASGRAGSGNIVSASGTRGLSSEELKAAQPDTKALAAVKAFAVAAPAASQYGSQGRLVSRQVAYLPAPAALSASSGNGNASNSGNPFIN